MAEGYQEAELVAGSAQVIVDLGTMFRGEFLDSLDFQDDLFPTDEIGDVNLLQGLAQVWPCKAVPGPLEAGKQSLGLPIRFPGTPGTRVRGSRSPFPCKPRNRHP